MNKNEASQFLGVSVRSLDNYTSQGRITPTFLNSNKSRPIADFSEEDLAALKEELEAKRPLREPVAVTPFAKSQLQKQDVAETSMVRFSQPTVSAIEVAETPFNYVVTEAMVAEMVRLAAREQSQSVQEIAIKPLLTFAEAAQFTGLSEKLLREAAREGKLTARKIGRSQRIRQADLSAWIDQQFVPAS